MGQPTEPFEQPVDGGNRDVLAVGEMDAFQARVSVHKVVDGLVGEIRNLEDGQGWSAIEP